jgi:hypothetical protein
MTLIVNGYCLQKCWVVSIGLKISSLSFYLHVGTLPKIYLGLYGMIVRVCQNNPLLLILHKSNIFHNKLNSLA